MTNRREFIHCTGAALTTLTLPSQAETGVRLPTRPIPGTGEPLPIIGLGNSEAFQSGDVQLSRQILDIFMEKGGAYVDTSGPGRFTVGEIVRKQNAQDDMFLGTYISSTDNEGGLAEIRAVQEAQDVSSLDLVLTRNVKDMAAHPDKFRGWKEDGLTRYVGVARPNKSFYEIMMQFMEAGTVDF